MILMKEREPKVLSCKTTYENGSQGGPVTQTEYLEGWHPDEGTLMSPKTTWTQKPETKRVIQGVSPFQSFRIKEK